MREGFYFNTIEDLMPFWRAVRRYKLDTEQERVALLRKFVAKKKAKYLRDAMEFAKDKTVLRIRRKQ